MKKLFALLTLCVMVTGIVQPARVSAAELPENEAENLSEGYVEYDFEAGGTQNFEVTDENGEEAEIVIEELPGMARVAKGTYKISKTQKGAWTVGFYVDVSANRIVKAYGKFYKAIKGSIYETTLVKNSDAQATLSFRHKYGNHTGRRSVIVKIVNKKFRVIKL